MPTVSEPAIFMSIYLRKSFPTSATDGRVNVLQQIDAFGDVYELSPNRRIARPYQRATDINLSRVSDSTSQFDILFQSLGESSSSRTRTYRECVAFLYNDALVLQIMVTSFSDWKGSFLAGWNELTSGLRSSFDEQALAGNTCGILGLSTVYWAVSASALNIKEQDRQVRTVAEERELRQTLTDLAGSLWECDRPVFPGLQLSQDLWMLITPPAAQVQVNRRFGLPHSNGPSDFTTVALARHKISFEHREYQQERRSMEAAREKVESGIAEILNLQRLAGAEFGELRGEHPGAFQRKLAKEGSALADYGQSVATLKELRRTVLINQRNFQVNAVALISAQGAEQVTRSIDQESAAAHVLAGLSVDEIFVVQLSTYAGFCRQLDSDLDYGASFIDRHTFTLKSALDQLQIVGVRELGVMAHHLSVDSAAVVASIVALIATEMVLKSSEGTSDGGLQGEAMIARWSLALTLVVGSFALTQILSSGCRGRHLERWSAAIALGFLAVFVASHIPIAGHSPGITHMYSYHVHEAVALLLGIVLGWFGHLSFKEYRNRPLPE